MEIGINVISPASFATPKWTGTHSQELVKEKVACIVGVNARTVCGHTHTHTHLQVEDAHDTKATKQ